MTKLFMYTANNTVKIIIKLCKYPMVYLDGKTRIENSKTKFNFFFFGTLLKFLSVIQDTSQTQGFSPLWIVVYTAKQNI